MKQRRHDGWTATRQELFIIYLEQMGVVSAAAKAVGMSPKSAYALYNRSVSEQKADDIAGNGALIPSFAHAWRNAVHMGRDHAFDLAFRRAIHGEARPVFYRGVQVGERIIYNYALIHKALMLTLRERGPRS